MLYVCITPFLTGMFSLEVFFILDRTMLSERLFDSEQETSPKVLHVNECCVTVIYVGLVVGCALPKWRWGFSHLDCYTAGLHAAVYVRTQLAM